MAEESDQDDPRQLATEAEAKALASGVRIRILRMCLDEPLTNKEIATRLEANPATVLHHVRKLVSTGFLEAQEERSGARGAREVPYLATRKSWRLRFGDRYPQLSSAMLDAFLTEVGQLPDPGTVDISRLGLRLTDEEYAELKERIKELLDELAAREPSGRGHPYSVFLAIHPDPGRD
ncbi:ArsR/SmtB family transcription factor [Glycomyces xiaoerkulensis]|uniref:ArsR/SmtB family transcription factor n=1 Tax=Glycomyces xiaoerkulensis TaxID=2038139 RepID=UPI0018E42EB3|nr:winged helix-turn-helix domain-containing protein [Glycomyces xiaoerkulensis]